MRAAFAGQGPAEIVFVAQQCLESGAWDQALALCEAFEATNDPALLLCRAVATFVAGERQAALELVGRVRREQPAHLSALAVEAQMLARLGNRAGALGSLQSLLDRYPDYPGAQALLCSLVMPGPHYRAVLTELHARLKPKTYLEIGVESGATLALAQTAQIAVGVDPADVPVKHALPKSARLFREESDQFFRDHTRESVFGAHPVDLVFIDGMHRFENALSDFLHAERWASSASTIVFHDCVPLVARTAARERQSNFWVGDTWKVVLALAQYRPDLRIRTLLCAPSGLVVVRRLDPRASVLSERFLEIVSRFADLEWSHAPDALPPEFSPLPNDAGGLSDALR